jgi:hypothetical protein
MIHFDCFMAPRTYSVEGPLQPSDHYSLQRCLVKKSFDAWHSIMKFG